jgi:N6-adenosine-specific RNA methylase IME4
MSIDDICALPVVDLVTDDAALFLWVVQPMIPEAMRVLTAWGFVFRTVAFAWVKMPPLWTLDSPRIKPRLGLGYHTRSGMEQCWLAVRGKGYRRQAKGVEQVVHAPLRQHSQKPDEITARIECLVGDVPRLELFAREQRAGWAVWGNETNKFNKAGMNDPVIETSSNMEGDISMTKPKLATDSGTEEKSVPNDAVDGPPRDIFDDIASLRLDQNFIKSAGVEKMTTTVPVRRPNPQDFVRVHPDASYRENLAVIELKEDREVYLLAPHIACELPNEFSMVSLYTTINRQGVVSLWPVKLPTPDGRANEWHRSAAAAAELAMERWIRLKANMSLGAYEIFKASDSIPAPTWPELSFSELMRIGFRDHLITDFNHAVIKRLRGFS